MTGEKGMKKSLVNNKARLLCFTLLVLALTGIVAVSQLAATTATTSTTAAGTGTYFDHVVIIVMEDHGINQICAQNPPPCLSTNGDPYVAGLANSYGIGSHYTGVSHFSQADYIALLGGDIYGCVSYPCAPSSHANLVDLLEEAGLTWRGYMENQAVPSGCDTNYNQPYTPEHNPFVFFTDITSNTARCSNVVLANPSGCAVSDCTLIEDLNSGSAPNFMWLTPNNCDNMHGFTYANGTVLCPTSVSFGDGYLSSLVPNILKSTTFTTQRSALFVVFDEGNGYCPLNQSTTEDCVYAVWAGRQAKASFGTTNLYNHYSWLRTIEVNWNLQTLTNNDANATPMAEFFAPPLSAIFGYSPSSPQVGQQVTFSASASGGTTPYSFSWSFGDGSSGTGSSATHTYSSAGTFNVILTVKDSSSPQQTATSQQSVTVSSPPPVLTASFTYSPSSPQAGQQVTFTASASGGTSPYSFSWSFGDGSTGTGSPVTHTYASAGSFPVTLTVKDNGSPQQTITSQKTVTITSPPPPLSASFTFSPSSPQAGQQVTFTASATGGTVPYSYTWNFGDGSTGTGVSASHTYTAAGTFNVVLTVRDSGSPQQTTSYQQPVSVTSPPPALTASFTYSPSSPQVGQTVSFTGSASGGTSPYSYSWSLGDGSTGTGSSATHAYSSTGSFPVVLTVKDSSSPQQTTTTQQSITVSSAPPVLSGSFSYSPSSPQAGQQITFTAGATGGTTPYTFSWSFGDGSTGTGSSVTHAFSSAGSYTVTLTVRDSGSPQQTVTSQKTVTVSS